MKCSFSHASRPFSDILRVSPTFHFRSPQICVSCVQGGSEDCLYLNVFVPMEAQNTSRLPCNLPKIFYARIFFRAWGVVNVGCSLEEDSFQPQKMGRIWGLVWIHGGGYEFGSSNMYDPTKLTSFLRSQKSPSVLVTFNYRLNVFGILASILGKVSGWYSSMQSWDEGRTCSWNLPSSGFLGSDHLRPLDALHSTGNYGLQALNTTGVRFGRLEIQKSAKVLHFSNHFGFMYSLNEIIQFFPRLLPVGWKIKERHADLSNPKRA